jgi:hypothetical protein
LDDIEEVLNGEIKSSFTPSLKNIYKKIKARPNIVNELTELDKNAQWMNKCSMLLPNDEVVYDVQEASCNVTFVNKDISVDHIYKTDTNLFNYPYGIFIHTDCLKYIKKQYKIDLKFSHLPHLKLTYTKLFDINYGDIEKYWAQDFNFDEVILDNKKYLCSSPLKNDKNISQIKKNISKLKLKKDSKRKGPVVSATFYEEGEIKLGNNKKFWIIKGNKWTEMNDIPIIIKIKIDILKLSKKQKKYVETLPFKGEYNIHPIFIINCKNKKNIYELDLIVAESYKDILMNKIYKT